MEASQAEPPKDDGAEASQEGLARPDGSEPLLSFKSRIEGKNANVEIWPDRIEWKRRTVVPLGKRDTNIIPIRMIEGVTTRRPGMRSTQVRVETAGNEVSFAVSKYTADAVKDTLVHLIAQLPAAASDSGADAVTPPTHVVADELKKLDELRGSGILSDEEFEAQKSRLLNPPTS